MREALVAGLMVSIVGLLTSFGLPWDVEEQFGLPLLFSLRGEVPAPSDAVIIDVNDIADIQQPFAVQNINGYSCEVKATSEIRSFAGPMPRCLYAALIDRIATGMPNAITIDISFERRGDPQEDQLLADTIAAAGNVILLRRIQTRIDPNDHIFEQFKPIHQEIGDAAFAWGPFPLPKRPARVNQFWTRYSPFGDLPTLPTLALLAPIEQIAQERKNGKHIEELIGTLFRNNLTTGSETALGTDASDPRIPKMLDRLRRSNSHYLNFYGKPGSVNVIDAFDLLTGDVAPEIRDKSVFIGQVHLDTYQQSDSFLTVYSQPNGVDLAGVEIAATAFLNLLNDESLRRISPLLTTAILIVLGFLFAATAIYQERKISVPIISMVTLGYTAAALFAFSEFHLWVPTIAVYTMAILAVPAGAIAQTEKLKNLAVAFVPQSLQKDMLQRRDPVAAPRDITGLCLKCDVENYSSAAHQVNSLTLFHGIDDYYKSATRIVTQNGGYIVLKGDDSFLAAWETPSEGHPNWPQIVACVFQLSALALRVREDGGEAARRNRIGMAYGTFAMGAMGIEGHYAFDFQGDTVNLAARLENLNKELGTHILAPGNLIPPLNNIRIKNRGEHTLHGQKHSLTVVELLQN